MPASHETMSESGKKWEISQKWEMYFPKKVGNYGKREKSTGNKDENTKFPCAKLPDIVKLLQLTVQQAGSLTVDVLYTDNSNPRHQQVGFTEQPAKQCQQM